MHMMSIRGDSSNVLNTHKVYEFDEYQGRILAPIRQITPGKKFIDNAKQGVCLLA